MRQMTDVGDHGLATGLFALVGLLVGADLLSDALGGAGVRHVGVEGVGAAVAALGALWFGRRVAAERREAASWRARAEELLALPSAPDAPAEARGTIPRQLDAWGLTPAEAEVALLLLKGLTFKEIGAVRETSERTAREQARVVYAKAGLAGRSELAAWFLDDLL